MFRNGRSCSVQVPPIIVSAMAGAQEAPSLGGQVLPSYQAPNEGLVAEIGARGSIRNGVEAQNPPFEFIENGEIVGFDIDLSRMFAEHIGVELDVIDTAWAGVIPSLYTKKFDMIWSAMDDHGATDESGDFFAALRFGPGGIHRHCGRRPD